MTKAAGITLHVGLPKCASSALQGWADANRDALADAGVDYPPVQAEWPAPKHQQMIGAILSGNLAPVEALLAHWSAPRLLLSTEGLSNLLYDFAPGHLAQLRDLFAGRCDTIVLMHRDRDQCLDAMWRQCLLNPRMPRYGYGLDLTREEFSRLPHWQALLDLDQLGRDLLTAYGARQLVRIDCRGDWLAELQATLGIELPVSVPVEHRNISIGDAGTELVRCLNGLTLSEDKRGRIMALMQLTIDSRNDTLLRHARKFGPSLPMHHAEISQIIAMLQPGDDAAAALAARMLERLDACLSEGTK